MEANKGANWYSQTYANSVALTSSLRFYVLVNVMTLKNLIRKGIPPVLSSKVWFLLSGAAKKKSTVPDSYYDDLTSVVQDRVTPATKQIDHVSFDVFNLCGSRVV
ncbi:growth hormone-regulated TBC protein 1-like protein [Tanacetum coccineum]